jgi:citrate synthase
VARELEAGRRIPGLGHPIHKVEDPRTPRIYEIAEETGLTGSYLARLRELAAAHARQTGRELPINGAGVAGAALADLGFPGPLLRGFALLARTAGLLGHLAEEMQSPIGMRLYREVDERAKYVPPTGE